MPYDDRNPHTRTVWLLEQRHARACTAKARKRIEAQLELALIREAIYYADHAELFRR
jgi:hypothetical protein